MEFDWTLIAISFSVFTIIVTLAISHWQRSEDPLFKPIKWEELDAFERLQQRLVSAGLIRISPSVFIMAVIGVTFIAMMGIFLVFGSWMATVIVPIIIIPSSIMYLSIMERSRSKRTAAEIVNFYWKIYAPLRAGRSHISALEEALMGGPGGKIRDPRETDTPLMCASLRPLLIRLLAQEPVQTALPSSLPLLPTSGWERLVRRFLIYEERGGDMPQIIRKAIDDENRALELQAELRTEYTRVVREQRTITVGSIILLPAYHLMFGGGLSPLFHSLMGWFVFIVGIGMMVTGIWIGQQRVKAIEEKLDF